MRKMSQMKTSVESSTRPPKAHRAVIQSAYSNDTQTDTQHCFTFTLKQRNNGLNYLALGLSLTLCPCRLSPDTEGKAYIFYLQYVQRIRGSSCFAPLHQFVRPGTLLVGSMASPSHTVGDSQSPHTTIALIASKI